MIDDGKQQLAFVARKTTGDPVVEASVNEYIRGNTTPLCPSAGAYTYGNIGVNPACSIATPTSHVFAGAN